MEPLLSAAMLVTDTVANDLLPVARKVLAMRHVAHQVAPPSRLAPFESSARSKSAMEQLECLLAALQQQRSVLPAVRVNGRSDVDLVGLAVAGWISYTDLVKLTPAPGMLAASGLAIKPGLFRVKKFSNVNGCSWRTQTVDARELITLLRHVTTACFLVITYLSGIRTGEALNLQRGCITRDPKLGMIFMSGSQLKVGDQRRERSTKTIPWVVTEQTAHAVSVLEQITVGSLLFPAGKFCVAERFQLPATRTRSPGKVNSDLRNFIEWFNADISPVIEHPRVGPDPDGQIQPSRLRRTLAWHIVRWPGGTIAGATQYGHLHTQMIHGYAGGADAGFLDEITFERFLQRAESIHDDHRRLDHGEHVSGPAAGEYRARVAAGGKFAGLTITSNRQVDAALNNPALQVHHGKLLTCVYRHATAACREATRPPTARAGTDAA